MGAEPVCLETLQEKDIVPKMEGEGSVEPTHPGIPSIKLVEVYKQTTAVDGINAHDLSERHSCCSHGDE